MKITRDGMMRMAMLLVLAAIVAAAVFLCQGCATLGNGELDTDGYELGRVTAVAYLAAAPSISEDRRAVVRIVWQVFEAAGEAVDSAGASAPAVLTELAYDHADVDTVEERLLVAAAVQEFWRRIAPVVAQGYSESELHEFLTEYRCGIRSVVAPAANSAPTAGEN